MTIPGRSARPAEGKAAVKTASYLRHDIRDDLPGDVLAKPAKATAYPTRANSAPVADLAPPGATASQAAYVLESGLEALNTAIAAQRWDLVRAHVATLHGVVVDVPASVAKDRLSRDEATLTTLARLVRATAPEARPRSAAQAVGMLDGLALAFGAIVARARRDHDSTLDAARRGAPALFALADAGRSLTVKELARAAGHRPETMSRRLPRLRNAGLVETVPRGPEQLNRLTPTGRDAVRILRESFANFPTGARVQNPPGGAGTAERREAHADASVSS